jgi:regulator of cell morphogenesis and NO signaling
MQLTKNMKMSHAIHANYHLLPVIKRFGIELGFGDATIEQVCVDKGIDTEFFLDIANSFLDENYFPKKHLACFSVSQLIEYLKRTHDYYLNEKLPLLEGLIKKLVQTSQADKGKLKLIEDFFCEYKGELQVHLKREEEVVYPYVLKIEKQFFNTDGDQGMEQSGKKYSIHDFADEHDNMEEKLYDLKNLLIKYLPPQDDQSLLHSIINELFELEKDLADHSRMEDKVLVPKIADMEEKMKIM